MTQAFQRLSYPLGFLKKLRNKAMGILKKSNEERETMSGEFLVIPYAREVEAVTMFLSDAGMRIAYVSGQMLQDLVRARTSDDTRREKLKCTPSLVAAVLPCTVVKRHGGWKED